MKKIFLVLAFLLIAFTAMAQDWFGLDYYVDAGWASSQFGGWTSVNTLMTDGNGNYYTYADIPNTPVNPFNSFYTLLGFDVWFIEHFFLGASITTQIEPWQGSIASWNPTFTNYMFEVGVQYGIFKLTYQHECTHPQNVYQYSYRVTSLWGEGAIDKITLQLHSSIGNVPK
jgi:hypothetical protein